MLMSWQVRVQVRAWLAADGKVSAHKPTCEMSWPMPLEWRRYLCHLAEARRLNADNASNFIGVTAICCVLSSGEERVRYRAKLEWGSTLDDSVAITKVFACEIEAAKQVDRWHLEFRGHQVNFPPASAPGQYSDCLVDCSPDVLAQMVVATEINKCAASVRHLRALPLDLMNHWLCRKAGEHYYAEFLKHVKENDDSQGGGKFALERVSSMEGRFMAHVVRLSGNCSIWKSARNGLTRVCA